MNRYIKYLATVLGIMAGVALFYTKVYLPKTSYERVTPKQGDLAVRVFGIGTLGARDIYAINAQIPGRIELITKEAGEWVQKGELLVRIDSVDLPQQIESAALAVKKARLERNASQKELASLRAQRSFLGATYKRYKKLHEQSFVSQSEFDKAKADLQSIDAQIAATQSRIVSASAEIKRAKAAQKALEIKLSRYSVVAPVDGYVIARGSDVGESVGVTTPILTVVDPKTAWVVAHVDERISGAIAKGQKATIHLRSKEKEPIEGFVKRIAPQSDPITQEREVDVAFVNLPKPFYINEQAEIYIETKQLHDVTLVPSKLLRYKNKEAGLWMDQGGKAHFVTVKVLGKGEKMSAVEGIALNTKLLLESPNKKPLHEGIRVH